MNRNALRTGSFKTVQKSDHGQYAIHGTNSPGSIGHFVSYGCIRMYNADIIDLYDRVSVGTNVVVLR